MQLVESVGWCIMGEEGGISGLCYDPSVVLKAELFHQYI